MGKRLRNKLGLEEKLTCGLIALWVIGGILIGIGSYYAYLYGQDIKPWLWDSIPPTIFETEYWIGPYIGLGGFAVLGFSLVYWWIIGHYVYWKQEQKP